MRQSTDDELRETFDYLIRRAVFFGECVESACIGVDPETWAALKLVAVERTQESVIAARVELERQISGLYGLEQLAVWSATRAGEIETHPETRDQYAKHGYPIASAVTASVLQSTCSRLVLRSILNECPSGWDTARSRSLWTFTVTTSTRTFRSPRV